MKKEIHSLGTEQPNPASRNLDLRSSLEIARIINREDRKVPSAVQHALPQIARSIDMITDAIGSGGRLIYVGAGTSGRIAALDASECVPTFNTDAKTVQYVMAGGDKALGSAVESNEDSKQAGERDLAKRRPTRKDVVVGLAASGRTPYTIAALQYARSRGAKTIAITCNQDSPLAKTADIVVVVEVGPEVVSGSTRMKAGTAQKLVLNMLSTGTMARLGYVFGNLMVNVNPRNEKLAARSIAVLQAAADVSRAEAASALRSSGNKVPVALVTLLASVNPVEAERRLQAAGGNVRRAIDASKTG